jgi:hypothetical protein
LAGTVAVVDELDDVDELEHAANTTAARRSDEAPTICLVRMDDHLQVTAPEEEPRNTRTVAGIPDASSSSWARLPRRVPRRTRCFQLPKWRERNPSAKSTPATCPSARPCARIDSATKSNSLDNCVRCAQTASTLASMLSVTST